VRNAVGGIEGKRGAEARPEAVSYSRGGFNREDPTVEGSTVEAVRL
jgi:hypothetical protein